MAAARTAFVTGGSGFIGGALIRRLRTDGWEVRALARSDRSAARLEDLGAEAVRGDLDDPASIRTGAEGCELAFHAAASTAEWGPWEEFERINVRGTRYAIDGCRDAGVRRFVHVGTEAALLAGQPLINVDETAPLRPDSKGHYPASKAMAERAVLEASGSGLETVVVRPRFVWGPGDTTVLPTLIEMIEAGRFAWVDGGRHLTSTTYIDNAVEGLCLGAERGRAGEAYFVTDGDPVVFRDFVGELVRTRGVEPPKRSIPGAVARAGAAICEGAWRALPLNGPPPLSRVPIWLSSLETTIDISKARSELGYEPIISIAEGLRRLRDAAKSGAALAQPERS
jgi:nucleoside-diphosphate-sugar epimerase